MKSPTDDTVLEITERHSIEIDRCPTCRGVWLDRGAHDTIIDVTTGDGRGRAHSDDPLERYLRVDLRSWDDANR